MDNVFIERLWRSVKHEGVYLWAHENMRELDIALAKWFSDDNHCKPHQALGYKTPWECYRPDRRPAWKEAALRLAQLRYATPPGDPAQRKPCPPS
jgi:hypothetical protein